MLEDVRQVLGTTVIVGHEMIYFPEIDSTNTHLKQLALSGAAEGTVVIADYQTAGRGRMERKFQSPAGKGIYLSVLLRPELFAERLLSVTALAGVAVCNAVERICGVRPGLKWPNDPVLGKRKLCGVLTELVTDPEGEMCLILGIGLNVLHTSEDFSPDVAEIATSLLMTLGKPVPRPVLVAALLEELDDMYTALKNGDLSGYLADYRRDCVNLGKTVQLIGQDGSRETVTAVDIDEFFGLVVRDTAGSERTIRSGEVSVRGLYGYIE